jgi:PAS domain-containing protein
MLSGERVGEKIGKAIAAFYENKPWAGEKRASLFENIYGCRQLKKWRIEEDELPPKSRLMFRPPGLYASFPIETTVLISLVALLFILSLALTLEMRRKRSLAKRLEQSQDELRAIFRASPDPIIVYDREGKALYRNPEFDRRFGWIEGQGQKWHFPLLDTQNWPWINFPKIPWLGSILSRYCKAACEPGI